MSNASADSLDNAGSSSLAQDTPADNGDRQNAGAVSARTSRPPIWLFVLQLLYLAALVTISLLYAHLGAFRRLVPDPAGPVPLAVPWWGALGGVTISLTGIFRNAGNWQPRYELWHIARPFLGAVVGSVAYLIFIVIIRSTGTIPSSRSAASGAVFDLVAFLVGYREEVFRELLKRASDSLFAPARRDKDSSQG